MSSNPGTPSSTPDNWEGIRYFKPSEFDSPDLRNSGIGMNPAFVRKLDKLREACGIPLKINSGFRTLAHNKKVSGVEDSAHTRGRAADIAANASSTRHKILQAAFGLGFRRIGLGASFIHLDDDPTLPQDVVWTYPETTKRA